MTRYYTGHTHPTGAVLIVFTIKTAPFICVCPVFTNGAVLIVFPIKTAPFFCVCPVFSGRWVDSTKMYLRKYFGCEVIRVAQRMDLLAGSYEEGNETLCSITDGEGRQRNYTNNSKKKCLWGDPR
jgi:hypothetical protein